MVDRDSRYFGVPDSVRVLPQVAGSFTHRLTEGERLDHLAATYYRDPRRWWRICDANPEFLSPLELVGAGALLTVRVPLSSGTALHTAVDGLEAEKGVVSFRFLDDPGTGAVAALVTYNRVLIDQAAVLQLLGGIGSGDPAVEPQPIERAGKLITIPPDSTR